MSDTDDNHIGDAARDLQRRAHELIPGGCHTYAKGDDQYPESAPPFIERGLGCHVWDIDGNEYIEYGMGLRAVSLGHAFPRVVSAVRAELERGSNFTRPSTIEVACAEQFLSLIPSMEMVKFCKDGSLANDGALRLSRAATGRNMVALCRDHPFFSTNDWFIGTTDMPGGIPADTRARSVTFRYNDIDDLRARFDEHPGQIACVVLEPARTEEPAPGYLEAVRDLVHAQGAVLVFDETITGFRWHLNGAQHLYGVTPDLSVFGKAMSNGFSVSALAGSRDLMELGGVHTDRERVFLLSTTHGAETHALAGAMATMQTYADEPVIATMYERGAQLRTGFLELVAQHGLTGFVDVASRDVNLLFGTKGPDGKPSQEHRTLFMQEMLRHGVLGPSFVLSYSHSADDVERTLKAADHALARYRRAFEDGVAAHLEGRPVKPAVRRFA